MRVLTFSDRDEHSASEFSLPLYYTIFALENQVNSVHFALAFLKKMCYNHTLYYLYASFIPESG